MSEMEFIKVEPNLQLLKDFFLQKYNTVRRDNILKSFKPIDYYKGEYNEIDKILKKYNIDNTQIVINMCTIRLFITSEIVLNNTVSQIYKDYLKKASSIKSFFDFLHSHKVTEIKIFGKRSST